MDECGGVMAMWPCRFFFSWTPRLERPIGGHRWAKAATTSTEARARTSPKRVTRRGQEGGNRDATAGGTLSMDMAHASLIEFVFILNKRLHRQKHIITRVLNVPNASMF
jgi:hypothetical protein